MSLLTRDEARTLLQKVLDYSKADECQVSINGSIGGNIRYALNAVSTSGASDQMSLAISSAFGKKVGTTTINEYDDASLAMQPGRHSQLGIGHGADGEYQGVAIDHPAALETDARQFGMSIEQLHFIGIVYITALVDDLFVQQLAGQYVQLPVQEP